MSTNIPIHLASYQYEYTYNYRATTYYRASHINYADNRIPRDFIKISSFDILHLVYFFDIYTKYGSPRKSIAYYKKRNISPTIFVGQFYSKNEFKDTMMVDTRVRYGTLIADASMDYMLKNDTVIGFVRTLGGRFWYPVKNLDIVVLHLGNIKDMVNNI